MVEKRVKINKKEMVCELKPNPTSVLKYTVEGMREGLSYEEATKKAREKALRAKKYHGMSKLRCDLIAEIQKDLLKEKRSEAAY